ncbi:MAG: hypothetical protein ABIK96_05205 [bacterium]
MKTRILVLLVAAVSVVVPMTAQAQQLFDFNGQTDLPDMVGSDLTMYSRMFDASPAVPPIPLDFANFEFTLVVTGLELVTDGNPQAYAGGTVIIYQDDATAADYANTGTFTDGTAILVGSLVSLNRTMFTSSLGSVLGTVDWTGGTRLDDIAPEDQDGWAFLSGTINRADSVEPGFDEAWDGKVEPQEPIVDDEATSWGSVKALFSR